MSGSQELHWVHWFTIGKIEHQDDYKLFIQPVDNSTDPTNLFQVVQFGYSFA